ncbi:MAG TPA: hypothetical protein VFC47_01175, partial [Caulobacteraceae bacterium]|nr:hypothetical protein [Caulobacteraceae bacterium]
PNSLHGRVIVGLLGAEIEARHGGPDFQPARLTVDMYRLPGLDPVALTTRIVREGWRIKVVEAEFFSAGVSMARASCQLLRRTAAPAGRVWTPEPWSVPDPETIAPRQGSGEADSMWDLRPVVGFMGTVGPRRLWMAEVRELVEGVTLTPFVRSALAADFASPFANAGDQGLGYINSDVTLYLFRAPRTRWIGMEVVDHGAADGVAHGQCRLHDEDGAIGTASVAALSQGVRRVVGETEG